MKKVDNEPGQGEQPEDIEQAGRKYKSAIAEIKAELKKEFGKLPADWSWNRDRKLPATLSREECQALMTAYKKGKLAVRNNLIIRTLYATGLRAEEIENLRFCDIFYDNKTVFVRAGKGDKDRYCAIDRGTLEQLKAWQEGKGLEESVFGITLRQIRRVVEGAGEMTGISAKYEAMGRVFSTHSMRHAYATHCYENSMRLPTLQRFLGHEYILTTMVYLYTAQRYDVIEYGRTHPLERE
jgi:integrase